MLICLPKHYLLGDTELTINKVIAEARRQNGNIEISGHSPPFKAFDDEDNGRMLSVVNLPHEVKLARQQIKLLPKRTSLDLESGLFPD